MPTESPTDVVNIVVQITSDEIINGYINVYQMSPEFAADFNNFAVGFEEFEGNLIIRPLSKLSEVWYNSENKNGEENDCFTVAFHPGVSVGGGGGDGNTPSSPSDPWAGLNWGRFNGTVYVFGGSGNTEGSGDSGNTPPSNACVGVEMRFTGETSMLQGRVVHIYAEWSCSSGTWIEGGRREARRPIKSLGILHTIKEGGKTLNTEDCTKLLSAVGIVPRKLSTPDFHNNEGTRDQIENAISQTCFNSIAVMDIIDVPAFEACYDEGTQGSICITNQVIGFLNGLDIEPIEVPGTSLIITTNFDNTPHEALSVFLNAAVAAHGNEFVLQAIGFANRKLNSIPSEISLDEAIIYLAKLDYNGGGELSEEKMVTFLHIVNTIITTGIADSKVWNRLAENPDHTTALGKVLSDYNDDEPSIATAQHYALEAIDGISHLDGSREIREPFIEANRAFFEEVLSEESPDIDIYGFFAFRLPIEIALLRNSDPIYWNEHPNELFWKAFRTTLSNEIHLALDLAGMFPALGIVPDAVNVVFYAIEGDWENATITSASLVPVAGQVSATAKLGMAFVTRSGKVARVGWHEGLDGLIKFSRSPNEGDRVFFSNFWGFARDKIGHHIIPQSTQIAEHPLIQKAARSISENADEFPFHMHDITNGIPLSPTFHSVGHTGATGYNNRMLTELNNALAEIGGIDNVTAKKAAKTIREWQSAVRANTEAAVQSGGTSMADIQIPPIIFN